MSLFLGYSWVIPELGRGAGLRRQEQCFNNIYDSFDGFNDSFVTFNLGFNDSFNTFYYFSAVLLLVSALLCKTVKSR